MLYFFSLLFKWRGWKLQEGCPKEAKNSVLIAAPHTSNWDFVYAMTALKQLGLKPRFTIKKEFNKPLIGKWMEGLGALWIDRRPKIAGEKRLSMTEAMVNIFKEKSVPITMVVTPEGTRSLVEQWKTGFYYVALEAKVPICCGFMDYGTKTAGVGLCFMPTGDINSDMQLIMNFYWDKRAKFPEKFTVDRRYT